jgi:hypothetical protein
MPQIKWKSKTLLAKIETAYGVDSAPTGAANAILALNVTFSPMEGQDVVRNTERPTLGADPTVPAGLYAKLSFEVDLVGSGTLGTAPAWGPLLRACAAAQVITAGTKVEYTPVTDNHESVSIYFQIDSTRHILLGAKGNAIPALNAQGLPVIKFDFTGLFATPTEQTKPTVDFTAWQAAAIASKTNTPTFTIGGIPFVLRSFSFDLGNAVEPRMLIGTESILITDKNESLDVSVEAVPVTTYNPYTVAQAQTLQAIQLIHGTVAARRVQLDIPNAQQARLTGLDTGNQNIVEWPLKFTPLPGAGNDQWKLTLA